jgi:plastocyanin
VRILFTIFWTAAVLAVAVLGIFDTVKAGEPQSQQHVVEIRNLEFTPKKLDVKPGDTITWINHDLVPHTVTADDESWDSGLINANAQWQTVVKADMFASYFCRFHPTMKARLDIVLK